MKKPKVKIQAPSLRLNAWKVLSRAVEEAVAYGYGRATKHTDTPSRETLCQCIAEALLHDLAEWFEET